jgi:uncharacterized repeat protein (TIGR01451 family)
LSPWGSPPENREDDPLSRKPTLLFVMASVLVAVMALGSVAGAQATGSADLALSKSVKPKVVTVGDKQTFTVKISNLRGDTARNVVMKDQLPTNKVRFIRASTSRHVPGSCSASRGVVTCELGKLRKGQTVTVKILVKNVEAGRYTNRASVNHTTTELDASDNRDAAQGRSTRD